MLDQRQAMNDTRERSDAYVKDVVVTAIRRKNPNIEMQLNTRLWDSTADMSA
jgi:hypothetical protein